MRRSQVVDTVCSLESIELSVRSSIQTNTGLMGFSVDTDFSRIGLDEIDRQLIAYDLEDMYDVELYPQKYSTPKELIEAVRTKSLCKQANMPAPAEA